MNMKTPKKKAVNRSLKIMPPVPPQESVMFVDADPARHAAHERAARGLDLHAFYDPAEAIKALGSKKFTIVSFDHEFGAGTEHANMLAEHIVDHVPPEMRPDVVIVHTHDRAAAQKLMATLQAGAVSAYHVPFMVK